MDQSLLGPAHLPTNPSPDDAAHLGRSGESFPKRLRGFYLSLGAVQVDWNMADFCFLNTGLNSCYQSKSLSNIEIFNFLNFFVLVLSLSTTSYKLGNVSIYFID